MDKDLMDMVAKCNCCGRPFLVDLEGDDKTCDYCLAEQEIIKEEDKHGLH